MTNEEALKWMEEAILDTDEFFDQCSTDLQKELMEQKQVFKLAISALRAAPTDEVLTMEQLRKVPHGKIKDSTLQNICDRANEISYPTTHINLEAWGSEWVPFETVGERKGVMCKKCGYKEYDHVKYTHFDFCPSCARAMTPDALSELKKRLRG